MSGETQDNGWIIKGSPVERKDFFFDIFSATHATHIAAPFLASPSDDPRLEMKATAVGLMLINTVQIFI